MSLPIFPRATPHPIRDEGPADVGPADEGETSGEQIAAGRAAQRDHRRWWQRIERRWWRRGGVGAAAAIVVSLTPTWLELSGLPSRWLEARLERHTHGEVAVDELDLSWWGPQRAGAVRIEGADPATRIQLDVRLSQGLLGLLVSGGDLEDPRVRGWLSGVRTPNGELTLQQLVELPQPEEARPLGVTADVKLDQLRLRIMSLDGGGLQLEEVAGTLTLRPRTMHLELQGRVAGVAAVASPLDVDVRWDLVDAQPDRGIPAAWQTRVEANELPGAVLGLAVGPDIRPLVAAAFPRPLTVQATLQPGDAGSRLGLTVTDRAQTRLELKGRLTPGWEALRLREGQELSARLPLNEPLQRELLYPFHPLLLDLDAEFPLELTLRAARIPLTGQLRQLEGRLALAFGRLRLRPSSRFLRLLSDEPLGPAPETWLTARLSPLQVHVSAGIARYDDFRVQLPPRAGRAARSLRFSGVVDLAAREVLEICADYPLVGLVRRLIPAALTRHLPDWRLPWLRAGLRFEGPLFHDDGGRRALDLLPDVRLELDSNAIWEGLSGE